MINTSTKEKFETITEIMRPFHINYGILTTDLIRQRTRWALAKIRAVLKEINCAQSEGEKGVADWHRIQPTADLCRKCPAFKYCKIKERVVVSQIELQGYN